MKTKAALPAHDTPSLAPCVHGGQYWPGRDLPNGRQRHNIHLDKPVVRWMSGNIPPALTTNMAVFSDYFAKTKK